jgi:phosphinothricin acetyltransferase
MNDPAVDIRDATPADAAAIAEIYNWFVAETVVTFEEEPVTAFEMARRMADLTAGGWPWLVAVENDTVVGYAYGSQWKPRAAYRFSSEVTVYLRRGEEGRGVGSTIYGALLERLRVKKVHAVMGGIALPNDASVRLHEKLGFKKVAHFERQGFKMNRWVDVGYWQLLL